MARRRRTRGTWFPTLGFDLTQGIPGVDLNGISIFQAVAPQTIETVIRPITFDEPVEGNVASPSIDSLSDIVGSEYVLQRIVGKCFISRFATPSAGIDSGQPILVAAGFFVARANDASSGGGPATPIGSATSAERRDNYSPLTQDTMREPWIWRRTWLLGTAGQNVVGTNGVGSGALGSPSTVDTGHYPASTALYGSVADGPHIDSKVKRRIANDNRLWFAVSAALFSPTDVSSGESINVLLDYRIYATLRKARGQSSF